MKSDRGWGEQAIKLLSESYAKIRNGASKQDIVDFLTPHIGESLAKEVVEDISKAQIGSKYWKTERRG